MKAESAVPNEPQVRTGTLYLRVSGVSRWWGQAVLSGGRIAQMFSVCRIMLQSTEMPRHGRRGKEKSSHGGRVSTVSSGIENLGHNSYRHLTAKRSPHDSNACLHHRLMPRIIETIEIIGNY